MNHSKKSIKSQLFFILILTSSVSLLIAGSLFIFFQSIQIKQDLRENLSIQANVIAENAKAIIIFEDIEEANVLLSSLHYDPQIFSAILLNDKEKIIAHYQRRKTEWEIDTSIFNALDNSEELFQETEVYTLYSKSIDSQGNHIGHVLLYADFSHYWQLQKNALIIVFIVVSIGFLASLVLAYFLQKKITAPIQSFADFVAHVTQGEDYNLRIKDYSYTEIDQLKLAFNNLLSQISLAISAKDSAQYSLKQFSNKLQDEVQKRTQELEHAKNIAEESSKAKSAFLANMSHEIRTPMNSIIGFTKLALENTNNSQQRYQLGYVEESANLLLSLIDNLLDFSKIDAQKIDLVWETHDLYDLIDEISQMMIPKSSEKGLELLINISSLTPRLVIIDALRLKQVLINLIDNAIKFTEKGFININVSVSPSTTVDTDIINFSISDSGIGINEETLLTIFDVFTQADSSITKKFGGTGLGLSICKELVSLMGGTLLAKSQVNQGSQFTFSLSLKTVEKQSANSNLTILIDSPTILLIDSHQKSKQQLTHLLNKMNGHVIAVNNATEALDELSAQSFQTIIIRRQLADIDCFSLIHQIRHNQKHSQSSIFIMDSMLGEQEITAFSELEYPVNFLKLPIFDPQQLCKSLTLKTLNNTQEIDIIHKGHHKGEKLSCILIVDDNDINRILMADILQDEAEKLLIAENGLIALEQLQQHSVDLVLMDVQMPVMDGYQATEQIRNNLQLASLPIIGITAFAAEKDKQRCLDVGMNEVIVKPIDLDKFRLILQSLNKSKSCHPHIKEQTHSTSLENLDLSSINIKEGLARFHNNEANYKKLLLLFYRNYQKTEDELDSLLNQSQWSSATKLLHDLKGVCLGLSITKLAEQSTLLEETLQNNSIDRIRLKVFKGQFNTLMKQLEALVDNQKN